MPYKIPSASWEAFFAALLAGESKTSAGRIAGISRKSYELVFRYPDSSTGREYYHAYISSLRSVPTRYQVMSKAAKRALTDFGFFRRRYFGRVPVPWQTKEAERITKLIASRKRDYIVINCPPGSGKTTFMRDLVCWLLVRDRSLRILWGSRVFDQALLNVNKIRDELTRELPAKASTRELETGLAFDCDATLMGDFGRFRPDKAESAFWTREKFTVVQLDGTATRDKEPSLTAFGFDGGYLGGRYDVCLWDDVDDMRSIRASAPVRENFLDQWGQIVENRLEPGGVFAVIGQRLGPTDLYRHCLDQYDANAKPIYGHIRYPAHFESQCYDNHGPRARPWPDGCMLDPLRLPWSLLAKNAGQRRSHYRVVYQQEDVDPDTVLIPRLWIDGGMDPTTKEDHQGCWDDRSLRELPKDLPRGVRSCISIDPSGVKFWAIEGWLAHVPTESRWLVDFYRDILTADQLLDQEVHTGLFSGVVEDMWQSMNAIGRAPSHVIAEYNIAQRHIFANSRWTNWKRLRGVTIVAHQTTKYNADPEHGVETLRPGYRYGRIRLPGRSKADVRVFADEHTNHPAWPTDDTVMADWFVELNYRKLFPDRPVDQPRFRRPSWVTRKSRYAA